MDKVLLKFLKAWTAPNGTQFSIGSAAQAGKDLADDLINKGIAVALKVEGDVRSYSLKADGIEDDKPKEDDDKPKPEDDDDKPKKKSVKGAAPDADKIAGYESRISELEQTITKMAGTAATDRKGITPVTVTENWTADPKLGYEDAGDFLLDVYAASQGDRKPRFEKTQKFLAADMERKAQRYRVPTGMKAVGADENWTGEMSRGGALMPFEFRQLVARAGVQPVISRSNGVGLIPIAAGTGVQMPVAKDFARSGGRIAGVTVFRDGERSTISASRGEFVQFTLIPQRISGAAHITGFALANNPSIGNVIMEMMRDALSEKENYEHIQGGGGGESVGIANQSGKYEQAKESGQAAATINIENVLNMYARQFNPGVAVWLADIRTFVALQKLTLPVGAGGVAIPIVLANQPGGAPGFTMLGRPIIFHTYGAALGTVNDLIFCDWSQYWIADHAYRKEDRTMFVRYLNDEDTFRLIVYTYANSHWPSTITQRNGFEQSPFITLATRS